VKLEIMRRTDVALRALRLLQESGTTLRAAEVAEGVDSTPQFVPQVLNPMVRAGWIESEPGPRGGYRLAASAEERSILELIELIEGPTEDGRCILASGDCSPVEPCAMHGAWTQARGALTEELARTPIFDDDTRG
jgi:Rrf2 family iron-sulfur cluster assembly transcriptional regulator